MDENNVKNKNKLAKMKSCVKMLAINKNNRFNIEETVL